MPVEMDDEEIDPLFQDVRFELSVDAAPGSDLLVSAVQLREALSSCFEARVEAVIDGDELDPDELLGRTTVLTIDRGESRRILRGIVREARAHWHEADTQRCSLEIVPSLWRLGLGVDSAIHGPATVPKLVHEVVERYLGAGILNVDTTYLGQSYEEHELLVQYQESPLNFICRWMEEVGIFWFLGSDGERETLYLADSSAHLPPARPSTDGKVPQRGDGAEGASELVWALRHVRGLGASRAVVGGWDWTRPADRIRAEREVATSLDWQAELYDHTDSVTHHGYDGLRYRSDTSARGAELRAAALELARNRWSMRSSVVSAEPGHILRVIGAGQYLITRTESGGVSMAGSGGTWRSTLYVVPTDVPYRPAPRTPRPRVAGPDTAIVVGQGGEEIDTDDHGRVKIQFHWDRADPSKPRPVCWARVQQGWAGDGYGIFFLPRIGMEVVVTFLGGNPDRPLVTGCVYNGANRAGVKLPGRKTESVIRTRSSTQSAGYNELRFEDMEGQEKVSMHAQRDMSLRVLRHHSTLVGGSQRNVIDGARVQRVGGPELIRVIGGQKIVIGRGGGRGSADADPGEDDEDLEGAQLEVEGNYDIEASAGVHVRAPDLVRLSCGEHFLEITPEHIKLEIGGTAMKLTPDLLQAIVRGAITLQSTEGEVAVRADAQAVTVAAPAGTLDLNAQTVAVTATANIESTAGGEQILVGSPIKLN